MPKSSSNKNKKTSNILNAVTPMSGHCLAVVWASNELSVVEMLPIILEEPDLAPLLKEEVFFQAKMDPAGDAVVWDAGMSFSGDQLRQLLEEQTPPV